MRGNVFYKDYILFLFQLDSVVKYKNVVKYYLGYFDSGIADVEMCTLIKFA